MVKDLNEEPPPVADPGDGEMLRKRLAAGLQSVRQIRKNALTRLHGLFIRCGDRDTVRRDLLTPEKRRTAIKRLHGFERNEAEHLLRCLELYERRIEEVEEQMKNEE